MRVADHAAGAGMTCPGKAEILAGGLAGDGASSIENARHDGGIEFRNITFEQRRAVHHRDAGNTDVVLDRDLLAAQQSFRASLDIRLPVPGAVRIFRCRWPVARRSRRNRRQRWRHQLVQPAIGSQRSLEGLLKCGNLVGGEDETKVRSEMVDLVQRRKANCHASPFTHSHVWETKRKKPSAARKGPEWHQCRCYRWSRRLRCRTKLGSLHSDVIGCVRTFSPCTYSRTEILCLSVASLVNARPAPFLC